MEFKTEEQLENAICSKSNEALFNGGLIHFDHTFVYQQFKLGFYGRADLVGITFFDKDEDGVIPVDITIYEIKLDWLTEETLVQIARYQHAFLRYRANNLFKYEGFEVTYNIVLIGKRIDPNFDFQYLAGSMDVICYTYECDFNGEFTFKHHSPWRFDPKDFLGKGYGRLEILNLKDMYKDLNEDSQ